MGKELKFYALIFFFVFLVVIWFQGAINNENDLLNNNSINGLFTGLGFLGLLITIYQQQNEINEQRKYHALEVFENGFFVLFSNYIESRNNIIHKDVMLKIDLLPTPHDFRLLPINAKELKGASFFDSLSNCFSNVNFFNVLKEQKGYDAFDTAFSCVKDSMSSYHSTLNTLIHYVTNARIDESNKKFYLKLILDQCVGYEKGWMYVYSLSHHNAIPQVHKMLKEYPELRKSIKYNDDYENKFVKN